MGNGKVWIYRSTLIAANSRCTSCKVRQVRATAAAGWRDSCEKGWRHYSAASTGTQRWTDCAIRLPLGTVLLGLPPIGELLVKDWMRRYRDRSGTHARGRCSTSRRFLKTT